jgi:hypothetical protein
MADAPRPPALLVGYPVLLVTAQALRLAPTEWSNESLQGFALHIKDGLAGLLMRND